jgi:hypothetical protein
MAEYPKKDTIHTIYACIYPVYIDLPLSYIHLDQETWEDYYLASVKYLAWNKKGLLTQIADTFCSRHRPFLMECADIEAAARGLDVNSSEFFELYVDWTNVLPEYINGTYPTFPPSPLASVIDPEKTMMNRRGFANIRIGRFNSVLLRVLSSVSRGAQPPELLSLLTKEHFQHYGTAYLYQFAADEQSTIRPNLKY